MRDFKFTKKDSYTPEDLELILEQHANFERLATKKELDEANSKLKVLEDAQREVATKERTSKLKGLAEKVSKDNADKIIKYAKLAEDMSDEDIEKAMKETAEDLGFATPAAPTSTAQPKVETKGKPLTPVEEKNKAVDKYAGL